MAELLKDVDLLKAVLLDKDTFTFAVLHNCVLLYDKLNVNEIHAKALHGDTYAIERLKRVETFDDARQTICNAFLKKHKNECFDSMLNCEMVEEFDLGSKTLLVCSKRRSATKTYVVQQKKVETYKAFFTVFHFEKIIKEMFLVHLKQEEQKKSILSHLTYTSWLNFTEQVKILLDQF
jgi:hypothetical protein